MNNFSSGSQRTPITTLKDYCSRHNLEPEYTCCKSEGKDHAPTYQFRVTVGNLSVTGSGPSKKKARHTAALLAFEKLAKTSEELKELELLKETSQNLIADCYTRQGEDQENISPNDNNPIGELQEFCSKMRYHPPDYLVSADFGQPHDKLFVMRCVVEGKETYETFGKGKSKKIAKRIAASNMLSTLEKAKIYHPAQAKLIPAGRKGLLIQDFISSKDEIENFYRNLSPHFYKTFQSEVPAWNDTDDEFDYYSVLDDALKMAFCSPKAIFIDASRDNEKTIICVMTVRTKNNRKEHIMVCAGWGFGETNEDARRNAAKRTLSLFYQITRGFNKFDKAVSAK